MIRAMHLLMGNSDYVKPQELECIFKRNHGSYYVVVARELKTGRGHMVSARCLVWNRSLG